MHEDRDGGTPKPVAGAAKETYADPDELHAHNIGKGLDKAPWDDDDMSDAMTLYGLEWRPSTLDDIESIPHRVLRLYGAFAHGVADRPPPKKEEPPAQAWGSIGGVKVGEGFG